eukprot:3516908-Rhodomonas_salina.3
MVVLAKHDGAHSTVGLLQEAEHSLGILNVGRHCLPTQLLAGSCSASQSLHLSTGPTGECKAGLPWSEGRLLHMLHPESVTLLASTTRHLRVLAGAVTYGVKARAVTYGIKARAPDLGQSALSLLNHDGTRGWTRQGPCAPG